MEGVPKETLTTEILEGIFRGIQQLELLKDSQVFLMNALRVFITDFSEVFFYGTTPGVLNVALTWNEILEKFRKEFLEEPASSYMLSKKNSKGTLSEISKEIIVGTPGRISRELS